MPIDATHPLDAVLDAAVEHARATGIAPMWAVTLLAGVNDGEEHARALAARVADFAVRAGVRPRLSLIPYNAIAADGDPFVRASHERDAAFRRALADGGVHAHRRYSGGADVGAACGQLAARETAEPLTTRRRPGGAPSAPR
jgi:23S rRNA (adenine2503-C2)-methyltransferase